MPAASMSPTGNPVRDGPGWEMPRQGQRRAAKKGVARGRDLPCRRPACLPAVFGAGTDETHPPDR